MIANKYNFSDDFQDLILACLLRHPSDFYGYVDIIKPEFFNGSAACETAIRLFEYVKKYQNFPTFTMLGNFAHARSVQSDPDRARELNEYIQKLAKIDTRDYEAVRELSVKFARERSLFIALREIHMKQQEGKIHTIDPVKIVEDAINIGAEPHSDGIELTTDFEEVIRKTNSTEYGISTGYPLLDRIWRNGWGPGWLISLLAPPKGFKSTFALNLALNMVRNPQRTDVLYFACEISEELSMMRVLHNLTGKSPNSIFEDGLEKFINESREKVFTEANRARFWFKGYPSKSVTIAAMKAQAKRLKSMYDFNPRAIFIDYAETVKPTNAQAQDYRQQADVFVEARAMGQELGCTIIMPDRCNRETVNKRVPDMTSFQGALEKSGAVDAGIGICGSPAERKQGKIRYFVFLNRHGDQYGHFEGRVQADIMRMTIDSEITSDADTEEPVDEEKVSTPKRKYKKTIEKSVSMDDLSEN